MRFTSLVRAASHDVHAANSMTMHLRHTTPKKRIHTQHPPFTTVRQPGEAFSVPISPAAPALCVGPHPAVRGSVGVPLLS